MAPTESTIINVRAEISAQIEKVWNLWTYPKHIIHWNNASADWHTTYAENNLRIGGKFLSRMEAKDRSSGFDFTGVYSKIDLLKNIEYTITGGRKVQVVFISKGDKTTISETFEAEQINTIEQQKTGWQSILDNFKRYAETSEESET